MAKCKQTSCPKCLPGWLVQFGDLMSLLLVFFILLLSMASFDSKKVTEAIGSLTGTLSVLEGGTQTEVSPQRIQQATPIETTSETDETVNMLTTAVVEYQEMTKQASGPSMVIEEGEEGFMLRLPANLLFKPDSAEIESEDAKLFLRRVALIIDKLPPDIEVVARGHTDNVQPSEKSKYEDNWELSTARAVSVVKELITNSVGAKKLSASGNAEFKPIATNDTEEGREKNRRVDLHFLSQKRVQEDAVQKSILDAK